MEFSSKAHLWGSQPVFGEEGKVSMIPDKGPLGVPGVWGMVVVDYDERRALSVHTGTCFSVDHWSWKGRNNAGSPYYDRLRDLVLSGRVRQARWGDDPVLDLPEAPEGFDMRNALAWLEREARMAHKGDRSLLSTVTLTYPVEAPGWDFIEGRRDIVGALGVLAPCLSSEELQVWSRWAPEAAPPAQVPALERLLSAYRLELGMPSGAVSTSLRVRM